MIKKFFVFRTIPRSERNKKFFDRKKTKEIKSEIIKLYDRNSVVANESKMIQPHSSLAESQ